MADDKRTYNEDEIAAKLEALPDLDEAILDSIAPLSEKEDNKGTTKKAKEGASKKKKKKSAKK